MAQGAIHQALDDLDVDRVVELTGDAGDEAEAVRDALEADEAAGGDSPANRQLILAANAFLRAANLLNGGLTQQVYSQGDLDVIGENVIRGRDALREAGDLLLDCPA